MNSDRRTIYVCFTPQLVALPFNCWYSIIWKNYYYPLSTTHGLLGCVWTCSAYLSSEQLSCSLFSFFESSGHHFLMMDWTQCKPTVMCLQRTENEFKNQKIKSSLTVQVEMDHWASVWLTLHIYWQEPLSLEAWGRRSSQVTNMVLQFEGWGVTRTNIRTGKIIIINVRKKITWPFRTKQYIVHFNLLITLMTLRKYKPIEQNIWLVNPLWEEELLFFSILLLHSHILKSCKTKTTCFIWSPFTLFLLGLVDKSHATCTEALVPGADDPGSQLLHVTSFSLSQLPTLFIVLSFVTNTWIPQINIRTGSCLE